MQLTGDRNLQRERFSFFTLNYFIFIYSNKVKWIQKYFLEAAFTIMTANGTLIVPLLRVILFLI
jgi:hypothetical protein